MKKIAIILACMLVCLALFAGCTDKKGSGDYDLDLNNSVEIDIPDVEDSTDAPAGSDSLPDGITYEFKDPDNAGDIVVTPKE